MRERKKRETTYFSAREQPGGKYGELSGSVSQSPGWFANHLEYLAGLGVDYHARGQIARGVGC
jgi:hypothetical protein